MSIQEVRCWICLLLTILFGCQVTNDPVPANRIVQFEFEGFGSDHDSLKDEWITDITEGLTLTTNNSTGDDAAWQFVIQLRSEEETITDQAAVIDTVSNKTTISGRTYQGISNGIYTVLLDHGVIYAHPKQTYIPPIAANPRLKTYDNQLVEPTFLDRGFHEHTQHPIPMSAFGLEPSTRHLEEMKTYIRWLVRNRQNVLTFHFLNTVDMEPWTEHMSQIVEFAHGYRVQVGVVIGFVDQQQNAFRLIRPSEDGETAEAQIVRRITPILDTGLDWIGFQIGSSEFTKPDEGLMLEWLNDTVEFLAEAYPLVKPFAWIHITCGLDSESGGSFFHLPLQADRRLAAFVHTTMFYNMIDPAPVYDCEDFTHQMDFVRAADGNREMIYFPETAWWLGFDNNVPLATPIVGPSRYRDIELLANDFTVSGHVTFTTGREWTYWMYDHYLTRATWDATLTWSEYLASIGPMFGSHETVSIAMLNGWSARQLEDFYVTKPEIYFYLSGELPQDELGAQAGIVARPAKPSFNSILRLSDDEYQLWRQSDLALLKEIETAYVAMFSTLPEPTTNDTAWYVELYRTYRLTAMRAQHSVALYEGVEQTRADDETAARAALTLARALSTQAIELVAEHEPSYRYDLVLLARQRPSLTAYDYGYLEETASGKFWTRRDEQLSALIEETFNPATEEWPEGDGERWQGNPANLTLRIPANPLLNNLLAGLMPTLLLQSHLNEARPHVWLGIDRNLNQLPDSGSLERIDMLPEDQAFRGEMELWAVEVVDEGGQSQGTLRLLEPTFEWVSTASVLNITATLASDNVSEIVSGFGIQPEALAELLKTVWSIDRDQALPDRLPIEFSLTMESLAL